jgi:hypothetical protein
MKNGIFWNVTPCGSCKNLIRSSEIQFLQEPHGATSQKTPLFGFLLLQLLILVIPTDNRLRQEPRCVK